MGEGAEGYRKVVPGVYDSRKSFVLFVLFVVGKRRFLDADAGPVQGE